MNTLPGASKPGFAICPLCEEGKLVFGGLYAARCPACGCEPSDLFLKTLRQIVSLPDTSQTSHNYRAEIPDPRAEPEKGG